MRCERIGGATLYLADCRDVLALLPQVDAVITDPPYGIALAQKGNDFRGSRFFDRGASRRATVVYDDDPERVALLVREVIPQLLALAARAVVFPGPSMLLAYPPPSALGCVFTPNGAGRCAWGFQCSHPVLFYGPDPFLQDGLGGRPNSLRDEQPNRERIDHPCPKPLSWMRWAVARATRPGELVLDPFMGSGTTGIACVEAGRRFIGVEREPAYFDLACERIAAAQAQAPLFEPAPAAQQQHGLTFEGTA